MAPITLFHTKPLGPPYVPEWRWNPLVTKSILHGDMPVPTPYGVGPFYISGYGMVYGAPTVIDPEAETLADGFSFRRLAVDGGSILTSLPSSPGFNFAGSQSRFQSAISDSGRMLAVVHDGWLGVFDRNTGIWKTRAFDGGGSPAEVYNDSWPYWVSDTRLIIADTWTFTFDVSGASIVLENITSGSSQYPSSRVVSGNGQTLMLVPEIGTDGGQKTFGFYVFRYSTSSGAWSGQGPSPLIKGSLGNDVTANGFNAIQLGPRANSKVLISFASKNFTDPVDSKTIGIEGRRYYCVMDLSDPASPVRLTNIVAVDGVPVSSPDPDTYSVWDDEKRQGWAYAGENRVLQVINTGKDVGGDNQSNRLIELTWNGTNTLTKTRDVEVVPRSTEVVAIDADTGDLRRNGGRAARSAGFNPETGLMHVMDDDGIRTFQIYKFE